MPKSSVLGVARTASPAHVGKLRNAIDFMAPVGTPVLAAAEGMVMYAKDDSKSGGPSIEYWHESNFVVIAHTNGEFSRYDHLRPGSALVKENEQVARGQQIAEVGMTGFTYLPHLHFQVFVYTGSDSWSDFDTLELAGFE